MARPTITYGPDDADGMVTRLIAMIARGRFVRVGRGENHVHLTYIDDMIRGLILTGTHPAAAGQTFILAGPRSIAVRDLVAQYRTGSRPGAANRLHPGSRRPAAGLGRRMSLSAGVRRDKAGPSGLSAR